MAQPLLEESIAYYRGEQDLLAVGKGLGDLGNMLLGQGKAEEAGSVLEEALSLLREAGDDRGVANALNALAYMAMDDEEFDRAAVLLEECQSIRQRTGDKWLIAISFHALGINATYQKQWEQAASYHESSIMLFKELGDDRGEALVSLYAALVALYQMDLLTAANTLLAAVATLVRLDARQNLIEAIEGTGFLASLVGHAESAARLWGAAEAARERMDAPLAPADYRLHKENIAEARLKADAKSFNEAWSEGRSVELDDAVAEARDFLFTYVNSSSLS